MSCSSHVHCRTHSCTLLHACTHPSTHPHPLTYAPHWYMSLVPLLPLPPHRRSTFEVSLHSPHLWCRRQCKMQWRGKSVDICFNRYVCFVGLCVCMCVCVCLHLCACACVCVCVYLFACACLCVYLCACACVCLCMCMCVDPPGHSIHALTDTHSPVYTVYTHSPRPHTGKSHI